jgi:hypothetical protein
MKTVSVIFCIILTSSTSFGETTRERKIEKSIISSFRKGKEPKMDPKLKDILNKKFYSFDGKMVFPSFSQNVFWLNHLNPNFSISPRWNLETITTQKITVIKGKEEVWHWDYFKVGTGEFKDVFVRTDKIDTGLKTPVDRTWIPPGTRDVTTSKWVEKPVLKDFIDVPGEKNLLNWAAGYRADYLAGVQGGNRNDFKDAASTAFGNAVSGCAQDGSGCTFHTSFQIEIPSSAKLSDSCKNSSTDQCNPKLFVVGAYFEGKGGGKGEWKPLFGSEGTVKKLESVTETITEGEGRWETSGGDPIYEYKDVYKKEEITKDEKEKVVTEEGEPDKEEITYEDKEVAQRAKKEWKVSFAPAYFFEYDFGNLILNQNEGESGRFVQSIKEPEKLSRKISSESDQSDQAQSQFQYGQPSQVQQLQSIGVTPSEIVSDVGGPFMVKKFYTITTGVGATASANYANAGLLSQIGLSAALLPSLGGGATSVMVFDTQEYANKAKYLNIPHTVDEFQYWRNGDTLQYEVHGGVVFSGGAGFYGLAAGVSFLAQGMWQRTFSKLDKTTVLAKIDRNKMFSLGMYGAAGLAGISLDKFIVKDNALTFAIDINSKRGKDLLMDFIRGDMRKVQAAAENPRDLTVVSGMKTKGKTKGRSFSFGIGIPYLPASARWNKANFIEENQSDYLGSNRKKDSTTHAEVFSFRGKLFPLFKNTTQGFYSNISLNSGAIPTFLQTYKTGQYAFSFQRSFADKKDLEEVLNSLLKKTGLIGLLNLKIADDVKKVGSAEINFAIKFKTAATNLLIAQAENNNLEIFDRIGQGFINAYFKSLDRKKDDILELCPRRSLKGCEDKIRKETGRAFADIKMALMDMSKLDSKTLKSRQKFARAYSKFGDAMMENPFTLQTVLSMTLSKGADVYLSVTTSNTKKYEAILRATKNR